jgi:hypothetical protein
MARKTAEERAADSAESKADNVLVAAYVNSELLSRIDEIRWTKRIEGRSATVRMLIEAGLEAVK